MPPSPHLALLLALAATLFLPPRSPAQQSDSSTFELHGTVVNSVTGQPISGALVNLNNRYAFSAADGRFSFADVARGQYMVTARKPGFFTQNEISRNNNWGETLQTVPSAGDVTVKLFPEGIIYGDVKNDAGDPLEGIAVRAQRWEVENGRRALRPYAESTTDDEGSFRLPELTPGSYYLVFNQREGRRIIVRNARGRNALSGAPSEGVGIQYYPGVADASSATPVTIHSGTQLRISQILSPLRLYQISGVIPAAYFDRGISINLFSSSGNNVGTNMRLDRQTGEFHLDGIPAGNYLLQANAFGINPTTPDDGEVKVRPNKPLTAWLPVSVHSDISGLVLPFGNSTSIPIEVHDETAPVQVNDEPSATNMNVTQAHLVFVEMQAKESPHMSRGTQAPRLPNSDESVGIIEDLAPGTYSVAATPQFPGYVADLRCGSVDLLQDDLTVSSGASLPSIEVTVRDDGAELDGTITENGQPSTGGVLIFSQAYPKRSMVIGSGPQFSMPNLPPGTYEVVALKDVNDLEFTNPAAMAKYLAHATRVTLGPRAKSTVQLELQSDEAQQ